MKRFLITGSRDCNNVPFIESRLNILTKKDDVIIEGGCSSGADFIAKG